MHGLMGYLPSNFFKNNTLTVVETVSNYRAPNQDGVELQRCEMLIVLRIDGEAVLKRSCERVSNRSDF